MIQVNYELNMPNDFDIFGDPGADDIISNNSNKVKISNPQRSKQLFKRNKGKTQNNWETTKLSDNHLVKKGSSK
jgi:hypothetical protein